MRFPRARKILKRLLLGIAAAVCLFVTAAIVFAIHCSTVRGNFQPSKPMQTGNGIANYARPEDDTFLTYAEWYIVWSYQEKGAWQQAHPPSSFPYFQAIGQYWSGYCCSYGVVRGRYPFNFGDHLMLVVIGTSFTVEYALKGAYEDTIGRLSEWAGGNDPTHEDHYAAKIAQSYGLFVQDRPFYEFPFFAALKGLWSNTTLWGAHPARKWERKAWLSLDYGVEAIYCGLITLASHSVYGVEDDFTFAVVEHPPELAPQQKVKPLGNDSFIVRFPRYQKFTDIAVQLLYAGARFTEIAGNRQIMVTAIVPRQWTFQLPAGELLFSSPQLTNENTKRIVLRVPVADLGDIAKQLTIEHLYDY